MWPDMSMLGATNLRRVVGYDFHHLRKKYDVLSMWGIHPQWRLLQRHLETKGPGWYPLSVRRPTDSLAPRNASLVLGSFARPPSPCAPFPVSPLPCLRSDTVWLVLWPVTVLQGPCQFFVLRESAGLALFRSLTVPLLGSVPSRCRCFTLPALFAWFLWLFVVSCGTGWASTSIDIL